MRVYFLKNLLYKLKWREKLSKGLTLIEILIVTAIFSSIFGIILYFLITARDSFGITNTQLTLQQDLRRCLERMRRELSSSSLTYLKDGNGHSLNLVQKDQDTGILKCAPTDQECVYTTITFKIPLSWGDNGEITSWSEDISYIIDPEGRRITRREGSQDTILATAIDLVEKESGHGYEHDPNSRGCGFENLGARRLKISLVGERESTMRRRIRVEMGTIVYLRN